MTDFETDEREAEGIGVCPTCGERPSPTDGCACGDCEKCGRRVDSLKLTTVTWIDDFNRANEIVVCPDCLMRTQ